MPKAYWVVHVDVEDPDAYAAYRAANAEAFAEYGARFLVRGGAKQQMEGASRARTVVLEFPSLEAAQACYASPSYQAAKALRENASMADFMIVEGYDD